MKMSSDLLNLILMIQSKKDLVIRESMFLGNRDWYSETEKYYNSIASSILSGLGLKKNIIDFEYVLRFPVSEEMMQTEENELSKFIFR